MMIKSKFSNEVHKILEPQMDKKYWQRDSQYKELAAWEKVEAFDKISKLHNECSTELRNYFYKISQKKKGQKIRERNAANKAA